MCGTNIPLNSGAKDPSYNYPAVAEHGGPIPTGETFSPVTMRLYIAAFLLLDSNTHSFGLNTWHGMRGMQTYNKDQGVHSNLQLIT